MNEEKIISWIKGLLYVLAIGTPLFYLSEVVYPTLIAKTAFFEATLKIIVFLWLGLVVQSSRFWPRFTSPLAIGLLSFLGILTLTGIFGFDPARSFWSTEDRALGIFFWYHIGALVFLLSSLNKEINWRLLWLWSLGTASVVALLGFLQLFIPNLLLNETIGGRPGSTFGNPTFLAGYLSLHLFIALFLLLSTREGKNQSLSQGEKIFISISSLICFLGLWQTQTRGDILGALIGLVIFSVLFFIFLPEKAGQVVSRKVFFGGVIALVILGSVFWVTRANPVWNNLPAVERFRSISLEGQEFQPRLIALRAAWEGIKERPLLGWGWDNFNIVFNKNYDPKALESGYTETRFDKPHNVFFEYLISGGVFLLLAYLALFGLALFESWKLGGIFRAIVPAFFLTYLIRNFFVFETLGPVLILALFLGFVHGSYEALERKDSKPARAKHFSSGLAMGFLAVGILLAFFINIRTIQAASHQFWGFRGFTAQKSEDAIQHFRRSVQIWTPYQSEFKRDYAAAVSNAYFYDSERVPKEAVQEGITFMEEVARDHPYDSYNHSVLVDLYNQSADINPDYLNRAEASAKRALELSPNRQQILFSLAKTKSLQNDLPAALKLAKQGRDLSPNVPDGHFFYGLLSFAAGDGKTGYEEIKEAIRLGRKWKNYNEPLVIAGFFADHGHLLEGIQLYEEAKKLEPESVEVRLKLGIAYFVNKQFDLAREEIRYVKEKTDLKSNPRYPELLPILRSLGLE